MLVERIIVVVIWGYTLLVAVVLGVGIPSQVAAMQINTDGIPLGISLVFWTVPLILLFGFALARWKDHFTAPTSGFLVERFGEERVAGMIRMLRPSMLLMIATGLTGILGVGITLLTHRLAISLCVSSYFLAVGAGHLYAYLSRNRAED